MLKIAITGTSGTGKSTLAEKLSKDLSLPLIEEGYDGKITRAKDKTVEVWETEYLAILQERHALENQQSCFVADRCALDLMNGWMNNGLHQRLDQAKTQSFFNHCLRMAMAYHFVVITPWNSLPFVETESHRPGMKRNANRFVLLRNQSSTVGLAHMFLDKRRIIEIPSAIKDAEARVAFVVKVIGNRRGVPALKQSST